MSEGRPPDEAEPFPGEPSTRDMEAVEPSRVPLRLVPTSKASTASSAGTDPAPISAMTLDVLYRSYSAYVAAIAYRLLGRDDDVDDVVQDVFLGAWKGIGALRDAAALKGWLATVTVRIARRKLKMRRIKQFLRMDTPEGQAEYENIPAPGATAEQRVLLKRVYEVLDTVPVNERLAWTLRYVEREQLDDVAKLCDCSLATAKRRISAAQSVIDDVMGGSHD